jgi:threonine dehydrogenase-like Zn-dependent dehydrogenase
MVVIATYGAPVTVEPHDDLGVFEKRFTGSCGNLPDELEYLIQVVAGKKRLEVDKIITHRIRIDEVSALLEKWRNKTEMIIRPVVMF